MLGQNRYSVSGAANKDRYQKALQSFNSLGGGSLYNSSFSGQMNQGPSEGQKALLSGIGTVDFGLGVTDSFNKANTQTLLNQHQFGLQAATNAKRHEIEMDVMQAQLDAQNSQNGVNTAVGFGKMALQALPMVIGAFCERRLKQFIRSLSPMRAWEVVRDLPTYAFTYKHKPTEQAYGPMVDEMETIAPELIVDMGIAPDGEHASGVDLAKLAAYQHLALQQALQRIEALEAKLDQPPTATKFELWCAPLEVAA